MEKSTQKIVHKQSCCIVLHNPSDLKANGKKYTKKSTQKKVHNKTVNFQFSIIIMIDQENEIKK